MRPATLFAALLLPLGLGCQQPTDLRFGGYVEAEKIEVGSRVGGRIHEVLVEEGDQVVPGQVLVRFERVHLEAELAAAEHRVSRLKTTLEKLMAGPRRQELEMARAQLSAAGAKRKNAAAQYDRGLEAGPRVMSQQEIQNLETAVEVARAEEGIARETLAMLEEGTRAEDIVIARRQLDEAEAEVLRVRDQLAESEVKAPVASVVEVFDLQPGDLVPGGAPLATLVRTDEIWVLCFVPTTLLSQVSVGQSVQVTVDARPNQRFAGEIVRINRVAEYTPRNVQTYDQREDQVFGMKVRMQSASDVLRPGMAATVWMPKDSAPAASKSSDAPAASPTAESTPKPLPIGDAAGKNPSAPQGE
jgi:multidrug resistance efflux pump